MPQTVGALLVACSLLGATASAQTSGTGRLTGHVASSTGDALPGVTVTLEGRGASTLTDASGRFIVEEFVTASDIYTVTASLPGFETARRRVRLVPGGTATVDLALTTGCAEIDLVVERGIAAEALDADLVAHVRIDSVAPLREWRGEYGCVIASEVEASLLADSRGGRARRVRLLIPSRTTSRHQPGDEMIAALQWDAKAARYTHWITGRPVVNGVATLDDPSVAAGFDREMTVGALLNRLR